MDQALSVGVALAADVQPQEIRDNIVARHMRGETRDADRVAIAKALHSAQHKALWDAARRAPPPWQDW